jgi:membrane associated rhomboid family serine protease
MLALYVFGRDIENLYGRRPFLLLYLGAAVAGGALHCAVSFREPSPLLGASAAVYAVMVVYALHFPRQRVLFFFLLPLEVSFTVGLLIAFDLAVHLGWQTAGAPGGAANLVYLGGAAYGYAFFRLRGAVSRHLGRLKGQSARCEVAEEAEEEIEARLDSVLAKINREGMGALSKKEWEVLRKASKHYQRKT